MHLDLVLVAGATYGVNPTPPFLAPTTNDWVMNREAECHLDIEELFDLAASGRLGRMFLSGLQIDRWGNMNVTRLGRERLQLKLPGGGGGCNLSCDVEPRDHLDRCPPQPARFQRSAPVSVSRGLRFHYERGTSQRRGKNPSRDALSGAGTR